MKSANSSTSLIDIASSSVVFGFSGECATGACFLRHSTASKVHEPQLRG